MLGEGVRACVKLTSCTRYRRIDEVDAQTAVTYTAPDMSGRQSYVPAI